MHWKNYKPLNGDKVGTNVQLSVWNIKKMWTAQCLWMKTRSSRRFSTCFCRLCFLASLLCFFSCFLFSVGFSSLLFSSSIRRNISRQNDCLFYKWNKFFRKLDTLISLSNLLDCKTGNPLLKELLGVTSQFFFNTRQLFSVLTLNYSLFLRSLFSNVVTILSSPFCAAFCIFSL